MTDMQPIQSSDIITVHWVDDDRMPMDATFLHKSDGLWYLTEVSWIHDQTKVIALNPLSPEILYIEKGVK